MSGSSAPPATSTRNCSAAHKENEAVANPAKFKGEKGAKALAGRDYQQRMAAIFTEMRCAGY